MASAPETPQSPSARDGRMLDPILGGLVLALAFLAASFAVRNSDFFLHLATGRLIAQGDYHFGADPFAYTTEGVYWANHAWVFDLGLFWLNGLVGGTGLVIVKATALAVLAFLLIQAGGRGWSAPVCVAVAVLAMAPRLLLQPALASFVLLGFSLWLLTRSGRSYLLMPAVSALGVNFDRWLPLGPAALASIWPGRRLSRDQGLRIPSWLSPAWLAACLLNPHHVYACALPTGPALGARG